MDDRSLEPTAPTQRAFDWLGQFGDDETEPLVNQMAREVRELVPNCVALSVSLVDGDLTFTLMADRPGAGLLDAMQYLDDGPCVRAVREGRPQTTAGLQTGEGPWQLFTKTKALTGILSTLSLPLVQDGRTIGGVNLYASTPDAFDGLHEELAAICGAWAGGAITDADLSFSSRVRASAAPDRLQDRNSVDIAAGYVAGHQQIPFAEASERVRSAAHRANVSASEFARFLLEAHQEASGEERLG